MTQTMTPTNEKALAPMAREAWRSYWAQAQQPVRLINGRSRKVRLKRFWRRAGGIELAFQIITRELGASHSQMILEPGCGTGEISLRLTQQGHQVVMVDTSFEALRLTKQAAQDNNLKPCLLQASLFHLPLKSGIFDFEFNVGVLDHFNAAERNQALAEMLRVLRSPGRLVVLVNDARGRIHPRAMRYAQKKGTWAFGEKVAIASLEASAPPELRSQFLREYSRGYLSQYEFCRYFLPPSAFWQKLFFRVFYLKSCLFAFLNRLPGQYRIAVLEKR